MDSLLLLTLTVSLMFTGGQCYSQSMSCSTVNGRQICEYQKSDGDSAGAASQALTGPGVSYQDASAMTANSNTGQSSQSRTRAGNIPTGGTGAGSTAFAGNFDFPFGAPPTFGGGFDYPAGTSASESAYTGTGSTAFTHTGVSDGTGDGGSFAGGFAGAGAFSRPAASGFDGSGVFVGVGFSPSFGTLPTFDDGSSVPFVSSASDSANAGTVSSFDTRGSNDGGYGGFADFGSSGGFAGGGFPPFGVPPTFNDRSSFPFGTNIPSDSSNTGTASTIVTTGSYDRGFSGFDGSGAFASGVFPPSFGVFPPFDDGSSVLAGTSAIDSANTGTASTLVTSGSDGRGVDGISGAYAGGFVGSTAFGGSGAFAAGNPAMMGQGFPFNFVFGGGFPFGRR